MFAAEWCGHWDVVEMHKYTMMCFNNAFGYIIHLCFPVYGHNIRIRIFPTSLICSDYGRSSSNAGYVCIWLLFISAVAYVGGFYWTRFCVTVAPNNHTGINKEHGEHLSLNLNSSSRKTQLLRVIVRCFAYHTNASVQAQITHLDNLNLNALVGQHNRMYCQADNRGNGIKLRRTHESICPTNIYPHISSGGLASISKRGLVHLSCGKT